jgi:hypothetical protein
VSWAQRTVTGFDQGNVLAADPETCGEFVLGEILRAPEAADGGGGNGSSNLHGRVSSSAIRGAASGLLLRNVA